MNYDNRFMESAKRERIQIIIKADKKKFPYLFYLFIGILLLFIIFLSGCENNNPDLYLGNHERSIVYKNFLDNKSISYNLHESQTRDTYIIYNNLNLSVDEYYNNYYLNKYESQVTNKLLLIVLISGLIVFILAIYLYIKRDKFKIYEDEE